MSLQNIAQNAEYHAPSSAHSISSIESWLDSHPSPPNYEVAAVSGLVEAQKQGRRPAQRPGSKLLGPRRKRQGLSEINVNTMNTEQFRTTRSMSNKAKETPSKKRKTNNGDDDPTPRAPAHPLTFRPPLLSPSKQSEQHYEPQSPKSSTRSQSSASNPRSQSPSKTDLDLQLSDIPVKWVPFMTGAKSLSDEAKELLKDLKRIEAGKRVMPVAVKDRVIQSMRNGEDLQLDEEDITRLFSTPGSAEDFSPNPGPSDHESMFEQALGITWQAGRCSEERVSEPEWNSAVHYTLLDLALRGCWFDKGIWFHDVSTARITDRSLLPVIAATSKIMKSQMVDYAMVIRPGRKAEALIKSKIVASNGYSINQTDAEYVRFRPIALSIETKRAAIEEDKANKQLGTWVFAHFAKLQQLVDEGMDSNPPFLPLIMIQGHSWMFQLAEMTSAMEIVICKDQPLGHTRSIIGVYQLLAAVQRLAKWIDEKYRVWFESRVLDLE